MHFGRDRHIRMGVRQLNWLRLEHYKRAAFVSHRWRTLIFRALFCEGGLPHQGRALVFQRLSALSRASRGTRHATRCWVSGRARQAARKTLLARMHYRAAMTGGVLPHLSVERA